MKNDFLLSSFNKKTICYQCGQLVYELTVFDKEKFMEEDELFWLYMSCWPCKYKQLDEVKNERD